jgi:arginyl-tRNA synthetase
MKKHLETLLLRAIESAVKGGVLKLDGLPPSFLEVPKDPQYGDLASTVALQLARAARKAPRAIAEAIVAHWDDPEGLVSETTIDGPGYLNFRFSPEFWRRCLIEIDDPRYGVCGIGNGQRVLIEFVSANPTGPLHVGHGRGAVVGDAIARLMAAGGYDVTREYYVNDAGKQIDTLGRSTLARLLQTFDATAPFPEDGYPGDYLIDLVREQRDALVAELMRTLHLADAQATALPALLREAPAPAVVACGRWAGERLLQAIKGDLKQISVGFDTYVSERELRDSAVVSEALDVLEQRGLLYRNEGARWFRSEQLGDEKDRVIERSDGELTYFASDIGYHQQKIRRGYAQLINLWGADHHGYIKRVEAAIAGLGYDPTKFRVLLIQLVRLTRGGEPVRMGKRTGEFVTLREVVDEVGADATRFFFLMRKSDSHLDFDLDLAKKQSSDNPVFYVQYAHARICSLFRQAAEAGIAVPTARDAALDRLTTPEEREVVKLLAQYPDVVEDATRDVEPHRVVFFLVELAGAFHRSYNRHRVVGDDPQTTGARLYLAQSARRVLRAGLTLLGISAPESM